jgi:hypothetical protein
MKSKSYLVFVFIAFLLLPKNSFAESSDLSEPLAVTVIWDTASSARPYLPDFRSLSKQVVSSLKAGDYLEVITAHATEPRLRAAQFIQSGTADESGSIGKIFENIDCQLISDADLAAATELAFKRLEQICGRKPIQKAIIIIFTDGDLQNSQVKQICNQVTKYKNKNWSFYIAGGWQTNKKLLIYASQYPFSFSLINQANPSLWIQQLRNNLSANQSDQTLTKPVPKDRQNSSVVASKETERVALNHESGKDKENKKSGYNFQGKLDGTIRVAKDQNLPSGSLVPAHETPQEAKEPVPSLTPSWPKSKETVSKYIRWVLLTIGLLSVFLAAIWFVIVKKAKQWKEKISSHLRNIKSRENSGVLVARLNDLFFSLGQLIHFKVARIGSDPNNTIRVTDKSIWPHHLKIYRRNNTLMVKNLTSCPVMVNGTQVNKRKSIMLVLPSVLQLNENIKVILELIRPTIPSTEKQETKNEQ